MIRVPNATYSGLMNESWDKLISKVLGVGKTAKCF